MGFLLLPAEALNMYAPLSSNAMDTFFAGLRVLAFGMGTVIGVLLIFYIIIKLMIKLFPNKE